MYNTLIVKSYVKTINKGQLYKWCVQSIQDGHEVEWTSIHAKSSHTKRQLDNYWNLKIAVRMGMTKTTLYTNTLLFWVKNMDFENL